MEDVKPEEKSPLLLYMSDGENNTPSKNNKRVNFDKGRLYGISSGATAVFTDFPNYISPCWITAFLSCLIFFLMMVLMMTTITAPNHHRIPRCSHSPNEDLNNKTIHLAHNYNEWTQKQLELLIKIKNEYKGYNVHLVLIRPPTKEKNEIKKYPSTATSAGNTTRNSSELATLRSVSPLSLSQERIEIKRVKRGKKNKSKKRDHVTRIDPINRGFGVKNFLEMLFHTKLDGGVVGKRNTNDTKILPDLNLTELFPPLISTTQPPPLTLNDVIADFANLTVRNVTWEEAFSRSPMESSWYRLSPDLAFFAIRILHLWDYGGLSFKIGEKDDVWDNVENFSVAPGNTAQTFTDSNPFQSLFNPTPSNDKLLNFILIGRNTYEHLSGEVVAADDEGLHMFTKVPCHAFFGEVIRNLKIAKGFETVKYILQKTLRVFCKHGAVGNNYCRNFFRPVV